MFFLFLLAVLAACHAETTSHDQITATARSGATSIQGPIEVVARDCEEILSHQTGANDDIYTVFPEGNISRPITVQCDMRRGGWTMLLNRFDGSTDFNGDWNQMKQTVGNLNREFWLGLEPVHRLTTSGNYSIMVELIDGPTRTWQQIYNVFSLLGEANNYALRVEGFNEMESTSKLAVLGDHNNAPFSTRDKDNSGRTCTARMRGPGWFQGSCNAGARPFQPYDPNSSFLSIMSWIVRQQQTVATLPRFRFTGTLSNPWNSAYNDRRIPLTELRMKIRRRR